MASFPRQLNQRSRLIAITAIVSMHVLVLVMWPGRVETIDTLRREMAITFVAIAPKPAAAPTGAPRPIVRQAPARKKVVRPAVAAPVFMTVVPPVQVAPPVDTSVPFERSKDDIVDQAKLDVGKIDQELRKQRLDPGQRNTEFGPTKRERLIAGAMRHRGPLEQVETILPDGRRMTRVGNNCAVMESNSLVGARDVFKDGVKTKWSRCAN